MSDARTIQRIKAMIECCKSVGESEVAKAVAYEHIRDIVEKAEQEESSRIRVYQMNQREREYLEGYSHIV